MNDSQLLHLYLADHSEGAFRELVARHSGLVYGTALRRLGGDSHLAQDATQRVFLALVRKGRTLDGLENFAGWLHAAARLEAAGLVRTEVRRKRREEYSNAMNEMTEVPVSWDQLVPLIDETVAALEPKDREPVLLRYFSGMSYSEIGTALGTTEDSARKRVERAVEKLRSLLRSRGVASSSAAIGLVLEGHAAITLAPALQASITEAVWAQATIAGPAQAGAFMAANKLLIGFTVAALAMSVTYLARDMLAYREAARLGEQGAAEKSASVQSIHRLQAEAAAERRAAASAKPAKTAPATAPLDYLSSDAYQKANLEFGLLKARLECRWIIQKRHLSPEKADRLEALMAAQSQGDLEAQIQKAKGGDPQTVYKQVGPLTWQGIDALLGPDASKEFSDYLRSASIYRFVDQASTALPISEAAFTPDEVNQVVAIALTNDAHYQTGKGTDTSQVNWDAVWAPASQIVDDTKLSVLKTMVENQALNREINARIQTIAARP